LRESTALPTRYVLPPVLLSQTLRHVSLPFAKNTEFAWLRESITDGPAGRLHWIDKDHGRLETRRATFATDVSWLDKSMRENWKKLAAVGMIESEQEIKSKASVERRYFIVSSGVKTVEQFAPAARAHWGGRPCTGCLT
jgi:hypothetical protein